MSNIQTHILNGDALLERFPSDLADHIIVCRECLVDGPISAPNFDTFFEHRAEFIRQTFGDSTQGYVEKVVSEFEKLKNISDPTEITLWFEDDLFCQTNFWFCIHFLIRHNPNVSLFLARPPIHSHFGFGGLSEEELRAVFHHRVALQHPEKISELWVHYQDGDLENLLVLARELSPDFPFILDAVEAHIQRIPSEGNLGRPKNALLSIMKDLETNEFGLVFKELCKREAIYGFGDAQVKKLLDELLSND